MTQDATEQLRKLSSILDLVGSDPQKNIDILVEGACVIIGGAASLYNRLDDKTRSLVTWSVFQEPPDYQHKDDPNGHICYDATIKGGGKPVIINELRGTVYETSDSNVKKYGLRAYLGFPVTHHGQAVGSLCVVDVKPRSFGEVDLLVLNILAKAMAVEEERKHLEAELAAKLKLLEDKEAQMRGI